VKMYLIRTLGLLILTGLATSTLNAAAPRDGRIAGVVVDPQGTPQMGATVYVVSELTPDQPPVQLLTNARGIFSTDGLDSGFYSIRATLAGFLPAVAEHVHVLDDRVTKLQIALGSVFSSLGKFRRPANQDSPPDEWSWVLRTSASTRPILRWDEGDVLITGQPDVTTGIDAQQNHRVHSLFELASGSMHPGSISNISDSPGTVVAYNLDANGHGSLVFAGQFNYESGSGSGGFVTQWVPNGNTHTGPISTLVLREAQLNPGGPGFRGARLSEDSSMELGDRVHVRYGADMLLASYGGTTTSLRPRAQVAVQLSDTWITSFTVASHPWQDSDPSAGLLESAIANLDSLPTVLLHNDRPVYEDNLHEEIAILHKLSSNSSLTGAIFHDRGSNTAVIGRGGSTSSDFLQDFYSDAFAYDAGASSSFGARLVYEQKISDNLSGAVIYSYAGALVPGIESSTTQSLRDMLETRDRQGVAAKFKTRIPRTATELSVGYKWIEGSVVSRQDAYGEAAYNVDPYLSVIIRQPLPKFIPGHAVATADFGNLLAEGYVPLETRDGRVFLVSAYRSFRGGLSFQF
jgi:Carboxypeptidase regulatory-like domain